MSSCCQETTSYQLQARQSKQLLYPPWRLGRFYNPVCLQVVLMSATIENKLFADYYGLRLSGRLEPAAIVNVEGKAFSVVDFFLDDLTHIGKAVSTVQK